MSVVRAYNTTGVNESEQTDFFQVVIKKMPNRPTIVNFIGHEMILRTLSKNVVSCKCAARAKGISLENELKSLVLSTSKGFCLLHIPGNKTANLRAVKKLLGVKQACLASREDLRLFGSKPGTINPFSPEMQKLPQLVSSELFQIKTISTNYGGSLRKYVVFEPELLLHMKNIKIGNFSK